jgi:macrolide-specific efflux system membrane fusion protein
MANLLRRRRGVLLNLTLSLVLLGAAAFAGFTYLRGDSAAAGSTGTTTAAVARMDVESSVSASGAAEPKVTRSASFGSDGIVTQVLVAVGDHVRAGDVLARASSGSARLALDAARAAYDSSATAYDNAVGAADDAADTADATDDDTADAAEDTAYSALLQAKTTLRQAEQTVHGLVLRAPISGTVVDLAGGVGDSTAGADASAESDTADTSTGFASISQLSAFVVTGDFSEADTADLEIGDSASVAFNALPSKTYDGKVTGIDLTATTSDSVVTYGVEVLVPRPPRRLRPGQTATITVTTGEAKDVLAVPSNAVTSVGGVSTVELVEGDTTTTTTVRTGLEGDAYTEVKSGLDVGDEVAITIDTSSSSDFPLGDFPGGGITRIAPGGPTDSK